MSAASPPLAGPGDDALLGQRHTGVDQQRVQGQVAMVPERRQHRLRYRADAHLHGRPVGHEGGEVAADRPLDLANDRRWILGERLVDFDPGVDLAGMQPAVASRAGHGAVHLGDDERRGARRRQGHAHRHAQAEVAARVGRGGVHQHAVGCPVPAGGELGDEVEVAQGNEVDPATPPRVVQPWRHVPRRVPQRGVLGPRPRVVAEMNAAHQREVAQALGLATDLAHERARLAAPRRQQHAHAGAQPFHHAAEGRLRELARHRVRYIHPPAARRRPIKWRDELDPVRARAAPARRAGRMRGGPAGLSAGLSRSADPVFE
jgi:hypothetical protein